jgi:hypothetical protein
MSGFRVPEEGQNKSLSKNNLNNLSQNPAYPKHGRSNFVQLIPACFLKQTEWSLKYVLIHTFFISRFAKDCTGRLD